jgi:brefeldin A-resistance guanine nucleotide exchange factor 1
MPANDVGIPVAVSARHILFSEISSVTSVMRKNSRWAAGNNAFSSRDSALASNFGLRVSGPSSTPMQATRGSRERDLMAGFHVLKRTVNDVKGTYVLLESEMLNAHFP